MVDPFTRDEHERIANMKPLTMEQKLEACLHTKGLDDKQITQLKADLAVLREALEKIREVALKAENGTVSGPIIGIIDDTREHWRVK